jgi:CubicO group peptidase (beta-lactamase class C family)
MNEEIKTNKRSAMTIFLAGFILGVVVCFIGLLLLARGLDKTAKNASQESPHRAGDVRITAKLIPMLAEHGVPALGAAVVNSKGLIALGVAGWRCQGNPTPVQENDAWHIGSNAKAMTATLAALAIERGQLRWNSRISEVFPDLAPRFAAGWSEVTLEQLLHHRSGAVANFSQYPATRRDIVVRMAENPRPSAPGYSYSNVGYVVAGAMLEQVTGLPWEQLITRDIFQPLGMHGCGFGGMGTTGKYDGIWGHDQHGQPSGNGPQADNPAIIGPAGTLHLPLNAWALFIADQLAGAQGRAGLLQAASYRRLFTPSENGEYAGGWIITDRPWANGKAMLHDGSNTMNYALVWLAPGIDRAFLVTTNRAEALAECNSIIEYLINEFPAQK